MTVLTTNHKDKLDEGLMTAGKIDRQFLFDLLGKDEIRKLLERFYPDWSDEACGRRRWSAGPRGRSESGARRRLGQRLG